MNKIRGLTNVTVFILFWSKALGTPEVYIDDRLLELSGPQCRRVVIFTCNALEFNSDRIGWYAGDTLLAEYRYSKTDEFPRQVMTEPIINATAQVLIANSSLNYYNFTLSVMLMELISFEGNEFTCGTSGLRSNSLSINMFTIRELELDVRAVFTDEMLASIVIELNNTLAVCESSTNFTTELRDDKNELLNTFFSSCYSNKCIENIPVGNFNSTFYNISIKAQNLYSTSKISTSHSYYFNYSLQNNNCALEVTCSSRVNQTCAISYHNGSMESSSPVILDNNSASRINLESGETYVIEFLVPYEDTVIYSSINYTWNSANKDQNYFRNLFGIALTCFILGVIIQCMVFTLCISSKCTSCIYTQLSWKVMLAYSLVSVTLNIIALILWIIFGLLQYDTCPTNQTSEYEVLIAASVFSFLSLFLSFITIGGFLINMRKNYVKKKKNKETDVQKQRRSYHFSFANKKLVINRSDKKCATHEKEFISSIDGDFFCQSCGQIMCSECYNKTNRIFLWRTLQEEAVCYHCAKVYLKENNQLHHGSTISEISNYLRTNNPDLCSRCRNESDASSVNSTSNSTGYGKLDHHNENMEIPAEKCMHCKTVLCGSQYCYNQKCSEKIDENVYCTLCYVLIQRKNQEKL